MTPKTKQFKWQNRDVAAQDMLQLAYHAPQFISIRALELLPALHSSAILEDLEAIVFDETRNIWERRYAVRAIAAMREDVYVPQFARYAVVRSTPTTNLPEFDLEAVDFINLFSQHIQNADWFFKAFDRVDLKRQLDCLAYMTNHYIHENFRVMLYERIIGLLDAQPEQLSLNLVRDLFDPQKPNVLNWLNKHKEQIIDLVLSTNIKKSYFILWKWDELRTDVFRRSPQIAEAYNSEQSKFEARRPTQNPILDYGSSPIGQEIHELYQRARGGEKISFFDLQAVVRHETNNLPKRALATHLFGKLHREYDVRSALIYTFQYAPDDSTNEQLAMKDYVRFEAGEALRDIISPDVWEALVGGFFIHPSDELRPFMEEWIEFQTDGHDLWQFGRASLD